MKWIIRIVAAVVVLVVVVVVVGFWQMDRIATVAVQKATAFATQCETQVEGVDVSVFASGAEIEGLLIKNPEAFQEVEPNFLEVESGKASVDLGTLRSDEVVIPEVTIDGVIISLVGRDGKTNYETILESLARLTGEDAPKEEGSEKQFTISKVTITNVQVLVDMDSDPALGLAPVRFADPLTLKPIVLTDVGSGGVPLSQISADLIADILVQVVAQLGDQLGSRVLSGLTSGLSGVMGGAGELQAQLTTIAADLNLSSTIDVAEQLQVAERLGTGIEAIQDLIPEGGAVRDRLNNLPGLGGNADGDAENNADSEAEEGGGLLDRF